MDIKLDAIDRKILKILQENARTPIKEIAKEVFLSSPAVSNRIEKLEHSGILTGYHAQPKRGILSFYSIYSKCH